MTTVTIRMDDELKVRLDKLVDELGMNLTTFFMIYAKRAVNDQAIPFEIKAPEDPFWSKENQQRLKESEQQLKEGKVVVKTIEELERLVNG